MRRAIVVALGTASIISGAAALGIDAAPTGEMGALTRAQYETSVATIASRGPQAAARCDAGPAAEREGCHARAEALDAWHVAELEVAYKRDRESARRVQRARIEARYHLDRAKCTALSGVRKDRCLIDAHARKGLGMLEAAAPYEVKS